jgi:cytochrome c5
MSSKQSIYAIVVAASFCALTVAAQQNGTPATAPTKQSATHKIAAQQQDEGERVFQQRCSSCHNAPDGFSPRISGAVVRHMRARASLSQHEQEVLLRFFDP